MDKRFCAACYWGDNCDRVGKCEHFTPLYDDDDLAVSMLIEEERTKFTNEYWQYISESR